MPDRQPEQTTIDVWARGVLQAKKRVKVNDIGVCSCVFTRAAYARQDALSKFQVHNQAHARTPKLTHASDLEKRACRSSEAHGFGSDTHA